MLARLVAQLEAHLRKQRAEHAVERVADVEVLGFLPQVDGPEAHREQRAAQAFDDRGERFARGQFASAELVRAMLRFAPARTGFAQPRDDPRQVERRISQPDLLALSNRDSPRGGHAART